MTDLRTAAQMALDAMTKSRPGVMGSLAEANWDKTIETLRAALAQLEQTTSLEAFHNKLAASQEPLGAEAGKVLQDNLWDLYARSEVKNENT